MAASSCEVMNNTSRGGSKKTEENLLECVICLDTAKDPVITFCGHLYCWPCLHEWLEIRPDQQLCPICKAAIGKDKLVPLYGRDSTKQDNVGGKIPPRPTCQRTEQNPGNYLSDSANHRNDTDYEYDDDDYQSHSSEDDDNYMEGDDVNYMEGDDDYEEDDDNSEEEEEQGEEQEEDQEEEVGEYEVNADDHEEYEDCSEEDDDDHEEYEDYSEEDDDDDYEEEDEDEDDSNYGGHRQNSNANNPNNDAFWQTRGYTSRPDNWKELRSRYGF